MEYMQKVMRFHGFVTRMVQGFNSHNLQPTYAKNQWMIGWNAADSIYAEGRRDDLCMRDWIEVYQCRLGLDLGVVDEED